MYIYIYIYIYIIYGCGFMCAYVYVCKCVIWKQEKTAHILQCLVNTYQNTYHHGTRKLSSGWDTPPKIWKLIGSSMIIITLLGWKISQMWNYTLTHFSFLKCTGSIQVLESFWCHAKVRQGCHVYQQRHVHGQCSCHFMANLYNISYIITPLYLYIYR